MRQNSSIAAVLCLIMLTGVIFFIVYTNKDIKIGFETQNGTKENTILEEPDTTLETISIAEIPVSIFEQREFRDSFTVATYYQKSILIFKSFSFEDIIGLLGQGILTETKELDCGERAAFTEWLLERHGINASIVVTDDFQGTNCSHAWVKVVTSLNDTLFIDMTWSSFDKNDINKDEKSYMRIDNAHRHFNKEFRDIFEASKYYNGTCNNCKDYFAWWKTRWGKLKLKDLGIYSNEKIAHSGCKTEALEYFNKLILNNPENINFWIQKGEILKNLKNYNASIQSYGKALDIDQNDATALLGMADSYAGLKDYSKALAFAANITKLDPKNKANWLREGDLLKQQKRFNESIVKYEASLALDSNYVVAWARIGDAQRSLKNYNASVKSYRKALDTDMNYTYAWSSISDIYIGLKDYANAYEAANNSTKVDPKNKANWLREGKLFQLQGEFAEAIGKFDMALALDPDYTDAIYRKGLSLIALGKASQAIVLFDKMISLAPDNKQAYMANGLAMEANGNYSEALRAYNNALYIDPTWNPALNARMHILMAMKNSGKSDNSISENASIPYIF